MIARPRVITFFSTDQSNSISFIRRKKSKSRCLPLFKLGLLFLGQLLVLVRADLGHLGHGELRVLLLDGLAPLRVVQHVHGQRLLGHLRVPVVILGLVKVGPGLGQPGPRVGNHLGEDPEPADSSLHNNSLPFEFNFGKSASLEKIEKTVQFFPFSKSGKFPRNLCSAVNHPPGADMHSLLL